MEQRRVRVLCVAACLLLAQVKFAETQASPANKLVDVSGGFHMLSYPDLVLIPGTPVYYDPHVAANFFFYGGVYWIYQDTDWYTSRRHDGPWQFVTPEAVPLQILRVPVLYYCQPPLNFRGWTGDAPPRWGELWGRDWERRRNGWDR